jgi:hypothetical protein
MSAVVRRLKVGESTVFTELDDEMVLLNLETGTYFGLDALGTRIWKLIEQGATEAAIFELLLAEYAVEPPQLRADLSAFLDQLGEKGLTHQVND